MKRSVIKKRLWKLVSEYIRRKWADDNGYCTCVTCGIKLPWNDGIDAGHFIPKSRGTSVYFVEENIHPQCKGCNLSEGGKFEDYYPYMLDMYGQSKVDELTALAKTVVKITTAELLEMEQYYKDQLKILDDG